MSRMVAIPTPTPLRNHQMFLDIQAGLGPMYMRTEEAMEKLAGGDPARYGEGAGGGLGGLPGYDHLPGPDLGAHTAPEVRPSEVVLAEPYIMGSHSGRLGPG